MCEGRGPDIVNRIELNGNKPIQQCRIVSYDTWKGNSHQMFPAAPNSYKIGIS